MFLKPPIFHNKNFLFLFSAQAISNLGDWLHVIALFALVGLQWRASPLAISCMMLCLAIPAVLSGPLMDVIADRYQRKSIMITSDLCRCLLVVLIPLSNHIWEIGLLLCLLSVFSSLFEPAKSAVLKEAAGGEFVQTAVAFSEMINNLAKIAGPVIGGILVSLLGIRFSFYLDAALFVLSAILLAGLTEAGTRCDHSTPATLNTIFTDFLESFMSESIPHPIVRAFRPFIHFFHDANG